MIINLTSVCYYASPNEHCQYTLRQSILFEDLLAILLSGENLHTHNHYNTYTTPSTPAPPSAVSGVVTRSFSKLTQLLNSLRSHTSQDLLPLFLVFYPSMEPVMLQLRGCLRVLLASKEAMKQNINNDVLLIRSS